MNKESSISYTLHGDYYLPDLALPNRTGISIGLWGQRHLHFIKENHRVLYVDLLTSGKLLNYLVDLDEQAENMFSCLVKQMAAQEGVTEALKARDQVTWAQQMNNICNRAIETVNHDLIFTC